jgi:hypothetical protein
MANANKASKMTEQTNETPAAEAIAPVAAVETTPVVVVAVFEKEDEFQTLLAKYNQGSFADEAEKKRYRQIRDDRDDFFYEINKSKGSDLALIKQLIAKQNFTAFDVFGIQVNTQTTKKTSTRNNDARPSNKNEILITFKGGVGKEFNYHKGRVWEDKIDGTIAVTDQKQAYTSVPRFFTKSEAEIRACFTTAGKTWFDSEEGKKELAALISLNAQAKTDAAKADAAKAAKAKKTAPAPAADVAPAA